MVEHSQSPRNELEKSERDRQELAMEAEPAGDLSSIHKLIVSLLRAGEDLCKCRKGDGWNGGA